MSANTTTSRLFYATTSTFLKLTKESRSNCVYLFLNPSTVLHHNTSVNTSHFYKMNLAGNGFDLPKHSNCQFHAPAPVSAIVLSESWDRLLGTLFHLRFKARKLSEFLNNFQRLIYFAFHIPSSNCKALSQVVFYSRGYIKFSFYVTLRILV